MAGLTESIMSKLLLNSRRKPSVLHESFKNRGLEIEEYNEAAMNTKGRTSQSLGIDPAHGTHSDGDNDNYPLHHKADEIHNSRRTWTKFEAGTTVGGAAE